MVLQPVAKGLLERIGDSRQQAQAQLAHRRRPMGGDRASPVRSGITARGFAFILEVNGRTRAGEAPAPEFSPWAIASSTAAKNSGNQQSSMMQRWTCIEELIPLAPLHNPANVTGHQGDARSSAPGVRRWRSLTPPSIRPCRRGPSATPCPQSSTANTAVRRYGFHGSSHRYVAREAARHLGVPPER